MTESLYSKQGGVPEVALVFPPLVETNLGRYYPSTAVLAGYLSGVGIYSVQTDLNEDFAVYLLKPESLERMARGEFGQGLYLSPASMPVVAARLATRYRNLLVDEQGKHLFREDCSKLAYLRNLLAEPYRIDVPMSAMADTGLYDRPQILSYRTFFEHINYAENLPGSIRIMGISIPMGPQLVPALVLARYLKKRRPEVTIVLGGSAVSLITLADVERILTIAPSVDAVVRYDGERPLQALLEQRRTGNWEPEKVPGVSCRAVMGITHRPPEAGPALNSFPNAEYDPQLLSLLAKPEIGILQSRGCYWGKCAYCDYVELYEGSPRLRIRTPDSFVDEMEYQIKKHGIQQFSVITESLAPAPAARISELILQRGLHIKWHSFAMVDRHFTPGIFKIMVRAGCEFLAIGLETMTERVLQLMNKAATREDNIKFLRDAKAAGLEIKINLIPNMPSTTYRESIESLEVLWGLRGCFSFVSCFPFEATRSSRVGHEPERFGLVKVDSEFATGQAQFALNHLDVFDPGMTKDEQKQASDQYQAFAEQINNRKANATPSGTITKEQISIVRWRLAEENLDLVLVDGGIQCFNCLTQTRFQMPKEWPALIEKMRSMKSFKRAEFIEWFPSASQGEFYFKRLIETGILTICGISQQADSREK